MKWFKHLSGSLNDSIISEAIEKFGGDGYLVFFGILEMMSDEFDVFNPGVCKLRMKKVRQNLQLSRQKTGRILAFFDQKAKTFAKKNVSFFADVDGDVITLNCPRLKELCDEYTKKQIYRLSGATPDRVPENVRPRSRSRSRSRYKKATDGQNTVPKSEQIAFASLEKIKAEIETISKDLSESGIFENVNSFVSKMQKQNVNDRAILHSLIRCKLKNNFEKTPWAYCLKIIQIENGNYNEKENQKVKV